VRECAIRERFARDETDVIDREHHEAHADDESTPPRGNAARSGADEHEDDARRGKRELLLISTP
jgi:hypothetical protein